MAQFFWDLAFDFNATTIGLATPKGSTSSVYYPIQMGFVSIDPTKVTSPMTATLLNGILNFNLFNLTNPPGGPYTITNARIAFKAADVGGPNPAPFPTSTQVTLGNGTTATPEIDDGILTIPIGVAAKVEPKGGSTYFGPSSSFLCWSLVGSLPLSINGKFEMGALVTVQQGNEFKTFIGDPEMIVGGAG